MGHERRLVPPVCVKPFVKRQKSGANDAAAIVEAAQRPVMRFVAVKTEAAQADAALFRTRALFVRQRAQAVNSLRGQPTGFRILSGSRPGCFSNRPVRGAGGSRSWTAR